MRPWFLLPLMLGGCTGLASVQPSTVSSTAAGVFGIPAATVAAQTAAEISQIGAIAAQLQMLKAQLDGTPLPVLPAIAPVTTAPVTPAPMPTPTPTPPGTLPTGPTPNG
jgi:hypothetical protein